MSENLKRVAEWTNASSACGGAGGCGSSDPSASCGSSDGKSASCGSTDPKGATSCGSSDPK